MTTPQGSENLGIPSLPERREFIQQTSADVRGEVSRARQEGRAYGQEIFGPGSLGRIPSEQFAITPFALPQLDQDLALLRGYAQPGGALPQSFQQAQAAAAGLGQGISPEERQALLEQGRSGIQRGFLTSLRTLRSLQSGTGKRAETAEAREAEALRASMGLQRDLEQGLMVEDLARRQSGRIVGAQLQAQLAGQEAQFRLGQTGLGAEAASRLGALGQAGGTQQLAAAQLGQEGRLQAAQFNRESQLINLRQSMEEKQKALQTELATVGLSSATETGAAARALSILQQDISLEFGKRSLDLEQQAINKPAPEAPEGGMSVVCTTFREMNLMPINVYNQEQWLYAKFVDADITAGYHLFGKPLAKAIRGSRLLQRIFLPLALAWAAELNRQSGIASSSPFLGKVIFYIGRPICKIIGRMSNFFGDRTPKRPNRG